MGKMAMSPLPSRGSPPLQSGGTKSEVAHKWAKWLPHPCRLGDPHRLRATKSKVAHLWAKWLPHPCRLGDPHRLRAGGQNQKGPTCGQNGYLTPAVLRIPTASERGDKIRSGPLVGKMATSPLPSRGSQPLQSGGTKSEVAHLWAKWLPHPCRLGDPHRFRAGGQNQKWPTCGQNGYLTPAVSGIPSASERGDKIRSGPQVGKVATSPLPYRGAPTLQSRGQNQKWPTSGQIGYLTPAVSGSPTATERGAKSEVAHKWAKWLPHPCRIGDPHRLRAGGQNQKWPTCGQNGYVTLAVSGIPTASERGDKIRRGPLVGKMATSPLPSRGSPPLQSGGTKSEVAHLWAKWLPDPCRLGDPHRLRATKSEVAHLWAKWLPHPCRLGEPHRFRAGGQNQKGPTCGQNGYLTPAVLGIPTASERGDKIRSGPLVGKMATSPLPSRGSPPLQSGGTKSEVAHLWAKWLPHPCRLEDPNRFRAGGQNQKWPTCGQNGYLTPAVSGIPTASERGDKIRSGPLVGKMATSPLPSWGSPPLQSGGTKSEVAHKWAKWLPHPCRIGEPQRCRAGGKIRSGPQVGEVATSPLPYRGAPPLQSGRQNQKWPTSGQIGYLTPAVSGSLRYRAGGKIRSGPQVGKLATSPLPYRGSPPLQSGGQNQKWPTCGQNGYLTPAVSGIPTAAERGTKSEVAHKWAKWLPHHCRIGEPRRCRAGGKIRSGPQVGEVATSPLPSRGSPPLQSGGQNQKWPTSGQIGYLTPAVSGSPTTAERGAKSEVAHKWANWLPHPCRIGEPHRCRAGGKIRSGPPVVKVATSPLPYRGSPPLDSGGTKSEVAHKWAKWLPHPCRIGEPHRCRAGGKIRSGPQVGKLATSPLPYWGAPPLQSGGQNQKWPTSGQSGYLTPAVSGSPSAAERGAESEVAHKWAKWLPHPCRIGEPHRCRAGGRIRSGPQVGKLATSPLPYRGAPPLQSGGQNQKWPTSGQIGYLTPAVSGIPTAAERGAKSEVAHKWANWLPHPCRIGEPHRFRAGGKIRSGPLVGEVATSPLPYRGAPPLQSGGQNQKWPTSGQSGYLTPAVSGSPTAAERGAKSEVAHKWAQWLPHPCRIGEPQRCRAGGKIRSGPQVGKVATSPLPYRGAPTLQSGGQNQKWPTSGGSGYLTPAVSGSPTAAEREAKSEVAHKWANWLPHPCRIGEPHRYRAGGKIRSGPQVGKLATSPLPYRGSPPLQSGGQNQKWPTSGQIGYLTPAVSGSPTAAERGTKSEVAHKWAKWLPHHCRIGEPRRCRAGGKIRSGPQVGEVATSPLPSRGSPPLQSGGQNQKWPTSGQIGYLTPAVSGSPTTAERGAKSEVAHKWANWLPHPCRIGEPHRCRAGGKIRSGPPVVKVATSPLPYRGSPPLESGGTKSEVAHKWAKWLPHPCRIGEPHRCRAGGKIRSGPQVGEVATSPLPYWGAPPLQSGGQNQKWPTSGQSGYLTPAVSGSPSAAERGAESEVAHKWAKWLPHPCRIGEPHRCRAGGRIRSGPQVGKLATSPLPYRGAPPLQSGGQNQKWPTSGQIGYLTPAVSGIPTAAERGAESEVAHKWANWLPHACRIGDPLRFRAGGKIRSGPQVGEVATSPLPYRGAPPLQSGGQNQKWPTSGRSGYLTPAVSGSPTAAERGAKSEVAHKWAQWLPHPCRIGEPQRCRAGGKIRSGPQVGKLATSPLPYRGSPPLQSGGQNQKWPTSGQSGYLTPAVSGIPTA